MVLRPHDYSSKQLRSPFPGLLRFYACPSEPGTHAGMRACSEAHRALRNAHSDDARIGHDRGRNQLYRGPGAKRSEFHEILMTVDRGAYFASPLSKGCSLKPHPPNKRYQLSPGEVPSSSL